MTIKALFFAKFDIKEGPKVIHRVPPDALTGSQAANDITASDSIPLFRFADVSSFVIPRQDLCGNLITVCKDGYRVLGYPICVKSSRYDRNEFIFNFCLVLSEDEEFSPFKSVVQKLANLMKGLEEQSDFLSKDASKPGEGKIHSLCEMLMEDLNNYSECMIPIDELNTLNIKLFPTYAPPPPVKAWHVPIFTVRPETLMDENWDLTMQRIIPHINGISSVKHISILADADFKLSRRCIKHLLYYNCLLLLDIFSFAAIYAPTSQFSSTIASDTDMQWECARYVNTVFAPSSNSSTVATEVAITTSSPSSSLRDPPSMPPVSHQRHQDLGVFPLTATGAIVDGVAIVELYAALTQGLSVRQWYSEHSSALANIDLRRFITFGVIKGFLYRIHKYAYFSGAGNVATALAKMNFTATVPGMVVDPSRPSLEQANSSRNTVLQHSSTEAASTSTTSTTSFMLNNHHSDEENANTTPTVTEDGVAEFDIDDADLIKYLDGNHCFDQICTELEISDQSLMARLKNWGRGGTSGEVNIIHR